MIMISFIHTERFVIVLSFLNLVLCQRLATTTMLYETPVSFSWNDTMLFCHNKGYVLPTYDQICPNGQNNNPISPPLGAIPNNQWIAYDGYQNEHWVQIGIGVDGTGSSLCHTSTQPQWDTNSRKYTVCVPPSLSSCAAGFYCSNNTAMTLCPKGSYCPVQSKAPIPCPRTFHVQTTAQGHSSYPSTGWSGKFYQRFNSSGHAIMLNDRPTYENSEGVIVKFELATDWCGDQMLSDKPGWAFWADGHHRACILDERSNVDSVMPPVNAKWTLRSAVTVGTYLKILANTVETEGLSTVDMCTCPQDYFTVHNQCVSYSDDRLSWSGANTACSEDGALTGVFSMSDALIVNELIEKRSWVSLKEESNPNRYEYPTGAVLDESFTNGFGNSEVCMTLYPSGGFGDYSCELSSTSIGYICSYCPIEPAQYWVGTECVRDTACGAGMHMVKGNVLVGHQQISSCEPCVAGYFCPYNELPKICPSGWYCPSGSSFPERCPVRSPGEAIMAEGLTSMTECSIEHTFQSLYSPEDGYKWLMNKGDNPSTTLQECEGDCDSNTNCASGLQCYFRESSANIPPGCRTGYGVNDVPSHDYCYNPDRANDVILSEVQLLTIPHDPLISGMIVEIWGAGGGGGGTRASSGSEGPSVGGWGGNGGYSTCYIDIDHTLSGAYEIYVGKGGKGGAFMHCPQDDSMCITGIGGSGYGRGGFGLGVKSGWRGGGGGGASALTLDGVPLVIAGGGGGGGGCLDIPASGMCDAFTSSGGDGGGIAGGQGGNTAVAGKPGTGTGVGTAVVTMLDGYNTQSDPGVLANGGTGDWYAGGGGGGFFGASGGSYNSFLGAGGGGGSGSVVGCSDSVSLVGITINMTIVVGDIPVGLARGGTPGTPLSAGGDGGDGFVRVKFYKSCPVGFYCKDLISSPSACPEGTFSNVTGLNATDQCIPCPAGTYSSSGSTSCKKCPEGSTSNTGSATCYLVLKEDSLTCTAGAYKTSLNATTCTPCSPGTYNPTNAVWGKNQCKECQPGTFAKQYGSTGCHDCPAGSFSNITRASSCQICPFGHYFSRMSSMRSR
jgi:hypothetical protein